jgi:hypothetical protein
MRLISPSDVESPMPAFQHRSRPASFIAKPRDTADIDAAIARLWDRASQRGDDQVAAVGGPFRTSQREALASISMVRGLSSLPEPEHDETV